MEEKEEIKNVNKKRVPGSTIKLIAITSMLIDHCGASIVEKILVHNPANFDARGTLALTPIVCLYYFMRLLGRLAFPIFIFLMMEGFSYTRNRWKYVGRMGIFALVSEIPFDMALYLRKSEMRKGHIFTFAYQNVYFTLALGLLALIFIDMIREKAKEKGTPYLYIIPELLVLAVAAGLAELLHTDYGAFGVLAIYCGYCLKNVREGQMAGILFPLILSNGLEAFALLNIPLVKYYNGERGLNIKWLFYFVYPVHLLILGIICMFANF